MLSFVNEKFPYHYIKAIKAPQCDFSNIIGSFFAVQDLAFTHVWEIDTIECTDGIYKSVVIGQEITEDATAENYVLYKKKTEYHVESLSLL